jgi:hypothetical protein
MVVLGAHRKSQPDPRMTLGNAAKAQIVWCKACGHRVEPDPAEIARQYGTDTVLLECVIGSSAPAVALARSTWW